MSVNSLASGLIKRNARFFLLIVILVCAVFYLTAFVPNRAEILSKRMNIAMRSIGHDLLQRAGDFTSVVPPVMEKSQGVFQIEFQNEFAFQPDTLVVIVQKHLRQTGLAEYTVTVNPCDKPFIVYGFESGPLGLNNIPCRGREYPKGCYTVEIVFHQYPIFLESYVPRALVLITLVSLLAFVAIRRNAADRRKENSLTKVSVSHRDSPSVDLGRFQFDTTGQRLSLGDTLNPLTDKECKVLTLLYQNIGQLTSRDQLIQQGWTDEGVITGRSLDVFISKLRKKLAADPDIRITSVHGKGYRLEVGNTHESPL